MKIIEDKKLNIVATSDLHGYLPEITESADIAIIAGDIMPLAIQFHRENSKTWLETEFTYWINNLPVDKVFMVAGNHDAYFENVSKTNLQILLDGCNKKLIYLKNETTEYFDKNGLKWTIFGTPYCHIYGNWPFMRTDEYMVEKFKQIPNEIDIIISHDPPFAFGDTDVILENSRNSKLTFEHLGNEPLANRIQKVDYKILICGHIHGGDHKFNSKWKSINVSYLNEGYKPENSPFYIEI